MKKTKLNQVLAIEKGVKSRANGTITQLYHQLQKGPLLAGQTRVFSALNDEETVFPSESQKVQVKAGDILKTARKSLTELFDVTAQKDWANCSAVSDVEVDGETVLAKVPVTYLLFLEKQLTDLRTLLSKVPVLDSDSDWTYDDNTGVFKSEVSKTTKTKKIQRAIVLYPATPEHPAQTQLVSEDVVVGHWSTTKQSGALPADRREALVEKTNKLLEGVKFARERANDSAAEKQLAGDKVFNFIFA